MNRDERLAVRDVALHRLDVYLSDGRRVGRSVHVDVHDVLSDSLVGDDKCQSALGVLCI